MLDLPGAEFQVEEQGQGPCLVLLHGFGGNLQSWESMWPLLGEGRHLLRYDLRDFGGSRSKSDAAFTHTDDLAALLAAKSIARCDLVGVSMGGGVALSFALDHPAQVRSLTLISPQIAGLDWSEPWRAQWQEITALARAGKMDEAKDLWFQHPLFTTVRATPAGVELRREIDAFSGRQWVHDNHALVLPDIERLHELQPPTLLLTGACDVEEFRLMAEIIEASAPNVQRADIEGAGHMLHMEQPALCAAHITAFLEAVD